MPSLVLAQRRLEEDRKPVEKGIVGWVESLCRVAAWEITKGEPFFMRRRANENIVDLHLGIQVFQPGQELPILPRRWLAEIDSASPGCLQVAKMMSFAAWISHHELIEDDILERMELLVLKE
jgi:hypothetical protein